MRVNVINEYGVPTFQAAFWQVAAKGNKRCEELCEQFIEHSSTDEELMYHAIAAQAEGARTVLSSICSKFLNANLAQNRCLAVSLLAWVPEEIEIENLDQLVTTDPSGWVRKHAEWAVEVAKHEASVRRHYQQTLMESDRNIVLSRLQVMQPALTPTARWWHRDLELKTQKNESIPSDVQAAIAFFWYENKCKETPKLFGRDLSEYLRGERIHDLRSPKPRLVNKY